MLNRKVLVYKSFWVKMFYMPHYQLLHCYKHFNISRYCIILCSIGSYEPLSCLLWHLTNSIALQGHHMSHPMTTSYGATWTWSTGINCRKEKKSCSESWSGAVTAVHIFNTLRHPWLQFLVQRSHSGKQVGSCQDLQWIKLMENSNTFAHSKWKHSMLPVANANE